MSHTSAEYDHLDSLLRDWGEWWEKHWGDAMLPAQAAFAMITSDQPAGSRILCAEMSSRVQEVHVAQLFLPLRYRWMLFLWYAVQLRHDGGFWTAEDKAAHLKCTPNAFRLRVATAKRKLLPKYYQVLESKALQKRKSYGTSLRA